MLDRIISLSALVISLIAVVWQIFGTKILDGLRRIRYRMNSKKFMHEIQKQRWQDKMRKEMR